MKPKNEDDLKLIDHYEKIQDFAQKEIVRSSENYKILLRYLTLAFLFVIGIVWYFMGNTKKELDERYENNYKIALGNAELRLERSVDSIFLKEKKSINEQISKEFSESDIKLLVEKEAQKRIDNIADSIIKTKIENYFNDHFARELKIYFDLSYNYEQVMNHSDPRGFLKLVECLDTTKVQRIRDRAFSYIKSILEVWEYNVKSDPTIMIKDLQLPNLLDLKDKSVDVQLKSNLKNPDVFDYFLLSVKAYNFRHKTNYMPYEYKKILKIEN